MSDSDSPDNKSRKPLTAREQWKNLLDGLAEDALTDTTPLTQEQLAKAADVKKKLLEKVEGEGWEQKAARRKTAKPKYIN